MLVHGILKRGVYKPMRSHNFSRLVASTAAFIASGVFHEWLLSSEYCALFALSDIEDFPFLTKIPYPDRR